MQTDIPNSDRTNRHHFSSLSIVFSLLVLITLVAGCGQETSTLQEPILLSDDGGWCWFQDPRIVAHGDHIVLASVASGHIHPDRAGDVDAIIHTMSSGETEVVTLHDQLEANDHATPAFLVRPDERWLAVYTQHHHDSLMYYRISEPGNPAAWGDEQTFVPSEETVITYSNPWMLESEDNRIYNFYRGLDNSFKPSWMWSDDLGESWESGSIFIDVPARFRHRPYVRYRSNGSDTIHMIYTEGHPRDYDNSVYHIYYRDGVLHQSDGTPVASLSDGLERPEEGTLLYQGDADHVAWTTDMVLDSREFPRIVFSVKVGSANATPEENGMDQRYYYGRWNGEEWVVHEMAYAGTRLYRGEDEYTGLAAIDPKNPEVVYISTDADPETGEPLISDADGERHYEIFRGETTNGGEEWQWTALTAHSDRDNLRPVVADGLENGTFLAWLRGEYRSYTDYSQEVVGIWADR
ncbi:MAG: BNR-4 repeat-containing protein [Balneolaceae bacterium]